MPLRFVALCFDSQTSIIHFDLTHLGQTHIKEWTDFAHQTGLCLPATSLGNEVENCRNAKKDVVARVRVPDYGARVFFLCVYLLLSFSENVAPR